jgi:hypothetical protein
MSRHMMQRRGNDRGAAAVEFALVLPLLVMLVFGIIQFGFVFNAYITVTQAAREGARMASVDKFDAAAVKAGTTPLDQSKVTVSGPTPWPVASGSYFSVTVRYPYLLEIPFVPSQSLDLSSTATMRKE